MGRPAPCSLALRSACWSWEPGGCGGKQQRRTLQHQHTSKCLPLGGGRVMPFPIPCYVTCSSSMIAKALSQESQELQPREDVNHPRPTNGISVAISVMNSTFASRG